MSARNIRSGPSALALALALVLIVSAAFTALAAQSTHEGAHEVAPEFRSSLYQMEKLKPVDSELKVKVGDAAPDFALPSIKGGIVRLSDYRGKKNVVLSFIPAAWTPVCSGQWPGYNIAKEVFDAYDATLIGLSVDSAPTLHAWTEQMGGVWFPVASDFWPHGDYAGKLGILRSDGMAERALVLIDKRGVIRYIDVHDINSRPNLGSLVKAMQDVGAGEK